MLPSGPTTGVTSIAGSWSDRSSNWLVSHRKRPSPHRLPTAFPRVDVATKLPFGSTVKDVWSRGAPVVDVQVTSCRRTSTPTTELSHVPTASTSPDTAGLAMILAPRSTSPLSAPVRLSRKRQRPSTGQIATSFDGV